MQFKQYCDGLYKSKWLSKFINQCGFAGNKHTSEGIIFSIFFFLKKKLKISPLFFFFEVIEKIKPIIGLKLQKKKSLSDIVVKASPFLLDVPSRYKKAIFWLSRSVKIPGGSTFFVKVFKEFYAILFLNNGLSCKKKKEYYGYALLYKKIRKFRW